MEQVAIFQEIRPQSMLLSCPRGTPACIRTPKRVTKRAALSLERHKGVAGPSLTHWPGLLEIHPLL